MESCNSMVFWGNCWVFCLRIIGYVRRTTRLNRRVNKTEIYSVLLLPSTNNTPFRLGKPFIPWDPCIAFAIIVPRLPGTSAEFMMIFLIILFHQIPVYSDLSSDNHSSSLIFYIWISRESSFFLLLGSSS